jgi:glycosyltransferase involved in cell wall biosynthesis
MKLLFIHEVNWTTKVKFEIHELPELLSKRGHEVHFIDFAEGVTRSGIRRLFDLRSEVIDHRSHTIEGSLVRVITPGRVFRPPFDRLTATLTFVPCVIKQLLREKYDLIVLYAVPTYGWQTVILSRLFGVPVLYRGLDVSHELRRTPFRRLILAAERMVYRKCQWLSLNNEILREYCVMHGANPLRTSVDYPGLDFNQFEIRVDVKKRIEFPLAAASMSQVHREKTAIYLGTLFRFSGLDRFITKMSESKINDLGFRLLIVGDGEEIEDLMRQVNQLGLGEKVKFVGRVSYEDVPYWISQADIAIVPFIPQLVTHNALPWKIVQYLAVGVAVVSTRLRGTENTFPEGTGVVYVETPEEMVVKVQQLSLDQEKRNQLVHDGQRHIRNRFDWGKNVRVFEELLGSLVVTRVNSK